MLPLVDEAKRLSREIETEICIQRRNASVITKLSAWVFKDFSVEERRIWSLKKTKNGIS